MSSMRDYSADAERFSATSAATSGAAPCAIATRDHGVIRQWTAWHQAEAGTGEATASGPATVEVHDGGAGIRFNYPGFGRFRSITWEEWFDNFDRHHLTSGTAARLAVRAASSWPSKRGL